MSEDDYWDKVTEAKSYAEVVAVVREHYKSEILADRETPSLARPTIFEFQVQNADPAKLKAAAEELQAILNEIGLNAGAHIIRNGDRAGLEVIGPRLPTLVEDLQIPATVSGFPVASSAGRPLDPPIKKIRPSNPDLF